jgi:hypothetical protein
MNPMDIASWITDTYGMGLTDAMRMTRTAQLYSSRQAAREVNLANADLLQGLVWCTELGDGRACGSCVAQHGQVYPVDAICDDHHNGRCALLPWVKGADNPIDQTGEDWFKAQPEMVQRDILGPGKLEAYNQGKFEFSQLSKPYEDEVFGTMQREATLKELVGE